MDNGRRAVSLGLFLALIGTSAIPVFADPYEGYPPVYDQWESFTSEDGLPDDHIYFVEVDHVREGLVWLGTDNGLVCRDTRDGTWTVYTPEDGLAHQAVISVEVDEKTGDVWVGTMNGLSCLSGGRFINFDQFNSGLANNFVYGLVAVGDTLWVATTAGANFYDKNTGEWGVFTSLNAPFHENWCYGVCAGDGKVFVAAWGGGVIEYDLATGHWQDYLDPDGDFEIDLFPNDGIVHEIVTAAAYERGVLWASTYFGLSVYDFRRWRTYFEHDSGLVSEFINFVRAQPGTHDGWVCTDKGLSVVNYDTEKWVTYVPDPEGKGGAIKLYDGAALVETRRSETNLANNFVIAVDFQGDTDVWVGTGHGLSHGTRSVQVGMNE